MDSRQATTGADTQEQTPKTKQHASPTVGITCVDCGATRTIARQEAFQVKRCVDCQEKYRKERAKGYRSNRIKSLKEQLATAQAKIQELEELLTK
jgi:Zn-finger protein